MAEDIDLRTIAFETTKYTGAQLANLVNTAGGFVGKEGREAITTADLQHVREGSVFGNQALRGRSLDIAHARLAACF